MFECVFRMFSEASNRKNVRMKINDTFIVIKSVAVSATMKPILVAFFVLAPFSAAINFEKSIKLGDSGEFLVKWKPDGESLLMEIEVL